MQPYVYRIRNRITNEFYYGAKYGKNADPFTFWKNYFTSSSRIKKIIEELGIDSFDTKIVKLCETGDEALTYEGKLILKTFRDPKSLNFRHSMGYCGVDVISINKMLKTRNSIQEDGLTSYQKGGIKRLETIGIEGIKKITAKTANTRKERGDFKKMSDDLKGIGVSQGQTKQCEFCEKTVTLGNFKRWHGDNCKNNPNITEDQLLKRQPWNKINKL
jgi:hypothetical protein